MHSALLHQLASGTAGADLSERAFVIEDKANKIVKISNPSVDILEANCPGKLKLKTNLY